MSQGGSQYKVDGLTHYQRNSQVYKDKSAATKLRNREYVRAVKQKSSCTDCGNADWRVLEFDHLPGSGKVAALSKLVERGVSLARLDEEMSKCELVCANCHRIRTFERFGVLA